MLAIMLIKKLKEEKKMDCWERKNVCCGENWYIFPFDRKKEFCTAANDCAMRSAESDEVNQALASVKTNFRWKVFCALVSARNENEMITDFNA